jgi:hypothetical protein
MEQLLIGGCGDGLAGTLVWDVRAQGSGMRYDVAVGCRGDGGLKSVHDATYTKDVFCMSSDPV